MLKKNCFLSTIVVLVLIIIFTVNVKAQKIQLAKLFMLNSYNITVKNGDFRGDGIEFIESSVENTQFVAIAEWHNSKEIPIFTSQLFKLLHKNYGFNYVAIENGPVITKMLAQKAREGGLSAIINVMKKYPRALAFNSDQELEFIASVADISDKVQIWGLDQAFGVLHIVEKLKLLKPPERAKKFLDEMIIDAKNHETLDSLDSKIHYISDKTDPLIFKKLMSKYSPVIGSMEYYLLKTLIISRRIYHNNVLAKQGKMTGYQSNHEREMLMKSNFMKNYNLINRFAPKVLLKFGHAHLLRGKYFLNVFTLGNFLSELAISNGMNCFILATYAINNKGVYWTLGDSLGFEPLAGAGDTNKWIIINMKPIRSYIHANKVSGITKELKDVIFGFDAVLLIGGASPGTFNWRQVNKK